MSDDSAFNAALHAENSRLHQRITELERGIQELQNLALQYKQQLTSCKAELHMFKSLVEHTPDIVVITNLECEIMFANPAARAAIGYGDALIGMHAADLYIEDPARVDEIHQAIAEKGFWRGIVTHRRQDESTFTIDGVLFPIFDKNGGMQAVAGIGYDATEQMRMQAELRASEERLRLIVQKMPIMITALDRDGNIAFWNEECERVTKYSAEEIVGNPHAIPMLMREGYDPAFLLNLLQHGRDARDVEVPVYVKDGMPRLISWSSIAEECPIPGWAFWTAGIDVTVRKQVEETYRVLVEHSLQALLIYQDGQAHFVNPAASHITGYTSEELLAMSPEELMQVIHPDDRARVAALIDLQLREDSQPQHYELRILRKDGIPRWLEGFAVRIEYRGRPAIHTAYIDVTERKVAERALQQTYDELQRVLTSVAACLWSSQIDERGHIGEIYLSPVVETITGYPPIFFLNNSVHWLNITHVEDVQQRRAVFDRLITGQTTHEILDYRIHRRDGTIRWLRDDIIVIRAPDPHQRLHGVTIDITGQKQADEALREREALYRAIFETNQAIKLLIDPETGAIVDANPLASHFYGYALETLRTMHITEIDLLPPEQVLAKMQRALSQEHMYFLFQHRLASGAVRDVEVYSSPIVVRGRSLLFSIIHNITERKQAERALRQSEAQYRQIVETAEEGIWLTDADHKTIFANPKFAAMLDYTLEAIIGKPAFAFFDRAGQVRTVKMIARLRQGYAEQFETRLLRRDGSDPWVLINSSPIIDQAGHYAGVLMMVTDITARKRTEEALRESEARFRAVWETATEAIALTDKDGILRMVNPSFLTLFGYAASDILGQHFRLLFFEERIAWAEKTYQQMFQGMTPGGHLESEVKRADGTRFVIEAHVALVQQDDQPLAMLAVMRDITERKRMEEELHRNKALLQSFLDHSPSAMFVVDLQGKYLLTNNRAALWAGIELKQIIGSYYINIFPEEMVKEWHARNQRVFDTGQSVEVEERLLIHGVPGIYLTTLFPIFDPQWSIAAVGGITTDINERKRAEAALEQQRLFLRQILDINPNLIFARDQQGRFTLVNQTLADLYGTTVENLIGKTDADLNPNLEEVHEIWQEDQEVIRTSREKVIPERFIRGITGWERWFSIVKRPIFQPDGTVDQVLVVASDITPRKRAEEELLRANELLLRSIRELEQRNREMALLNEMGDFFQACLTQEEAYHTVNRFAPRLFRGNPGGLYLLNRNLTILEAVATWGDAPPAALVLIAEACWALRLGRPYTSLDDENEVPCFSHDTPMTPGYICIPIIAQGETLGVFRQYIAGLPAHEQYAQLARTVAKQIALALANLRLRERLHQQAVRDPLTGLFNRRYLNESLERELSRAARQQHPVGVIMLDIDYFKQINDTYDHDTGDAVLRVLAQFLETNIRAGDIVCRYGGEEFTLVLPEASLEDTRRRAETLRRDITRITVKYAGRSLEPISASFGVAAFPEHGTTASVLIRAADGALYQAKTAGRNRVHVAPKLTGNE